MPRVSPRPPCRPGHSKPVGHPVACIVALALAGVRSRSVGLGLFGVLFGAAHFFWWSRGGSPATGFCSWLLLPFGEKAGMRGGSCAALSWGHGFWFWFWFGREMARLRRAFGRLPAPESLLFAGPKRRNQEKWPVEPADPTSLGARRGWNRQDTSCSTGGHTAPSPSTEAREGLSWLAVLRSLTPDRTVRSGLVYRLPHRYGCIAHRRAPIGNPSKQDIGRTAVGLGRNDGQSQKLPRPRVSGTSPPATSVPAGRKASCMHTRWRCSRRRPRRPPRTWCRRAAFRACPPIRCRRRSDRNG